MADVTSLSRSILETLAYSDIFDHPLTVYELHRFATMPCSLEEIIECLPALKEASSREGYYFLSGRGFIVELRKERQKVSRPHFERAVRYGQMMARLPFFRMVAISGSLAMLNLTSGHDMDFMLVARRGRVWTVRAFALLINRAANFYGDVVCPNIIVSESTLEWKARNLYAAREIAQLHLIWGEETYNKFRISNMWIGEFLPNLRERDAGILNPIVKGEHVPETIQRCGEYLMDGRLGDFLEGWERKRKINKLSAEKGAGLETEFNEEVCQGNFNHHGYWAMKAYGDRLKALGIDQPSFHVEDLVDA